LAKDRISEIRRWLAKLKLEPAREAAIVEEFAQCLEDCYAKLLVPGAAASKVCPFGKKVQGRVLRTFVVMRCSA